MITIKKVDFLVKSPIAHKGVHDNKKGIIENTIPAFFLSIEKGYTIELDVHIIKDGTIVVFHDDTLKRAAGIGKRLKEFTYDELKKITIFETKETIPTLKEVLKLVNGRVGIIIELKYDNSIGLLAKELTKLLEKYPGEFALQSFHPLSAYWFKKNKPEWIRGQIVSDFIGKKQNKIEQMGLKILLNNPFTDLDFVSCQLLLLPNKIIQDIKKEKIVLGWTVKNKEEKYKPYCDNMIYDNIK